MIDDSITELNKRLKKLRKEQASLQKKLKETEFDIGLIEDFIKLKKERKSVLHYVNGLYKKEIPLSFNKEMFNEKKVIYAINALTNGNVREISNFIHEIEGGDTKAIYKMVQQCLIKLTREYKILKQGDYASTYKLNIIDE